MFKVEMLKAGWGDCIWIEYGEDTAAPYRILIDGGTSSTYKSIESRLMKLHADKRHIELFVITHIDADHIEGAIKLLGNLSRLKVTFGDIWFNGYEHLQGGRYRLGGIHGEFLSALLKKKKLNWNLKFSGDAVVLPQNGPPTYDFSGNLRITILSPKLENLRNLIHEWNLDVLDKGLRERSVKSVLAKLQEHRTLRSKDLQDYLLGGRRDTAPIDGEADLIRLAKTDFEEDTAAANGSSIALLLEYKDPEDGIEKKVLLAADAFPSVISDSLAKLGYSGQNRLSLDLFKVSHHGSRGNTSIDLLRLVDCRNFFFSSSGQRFYHPNKETIARLLVYGRGKSVPRLFFNYLSDFNRMWENQALMSGQYSYETVFAKQVQDCLSIDL